MLKDEPAEQGLPVPGDGVHFVNGYAGADGGEGVAGEVEVGHGIYGEGIALLKTGQVVTETAPLFSQVAAAVDDALTILNAIWNTYSDEEKFPAAGGDSEHAVDGAPGSFDVSNADSLSYLLTFPADDASLIDSAASLVHMMNLNTFTCGAFHVADANNVARLADDLRTTIQAKHWMCGFPDKLVIVTVGQSVLSVYGSEELVNTFRDKLLASYPTAAAVYDEAINA